MNQCRANSCRQQGFTLIEIMVVVIIIGLAVSLVNIAVNTNTPQEMVQDEAQEFVLEANYVAEQSVLKGETHGLFIEVRPLQKYSAIASEEWCYQWRRVRDRQWGDLPELPQMHCLPEGMALELVLDDEKWEYDPELEYQDPVLGFFPSGDASSEIELAIYLDDQGGLPDDDLVQRVQINLMGEIHWLNQEAQAELERQGR